MTRPRTFAYHIAHFKYPDVTNADLFGTVAAQVQAANRGGFDRVHVMDHLYQFPPGGLPADPMLESYTTLAALSQHAPDMDVAAVVTGVTYRNPALVGKIVTTLDHVSGGRAQLGIGAGWYQLEHEAFGYEFQPAGARLDRLDEALQILRHMLDPEQGPLTFDGECYHTTELINSPPPTRRVPIIVGGDGERRTLRIAAKFADESNFLCDPSEVPRKLDVLAQHCDAVGRQREDVRVTHLSRVVIGPSLEAAEAEFLAIAEQRGMSSPSLEGARRSLTIGGPDEVGEELQRRLDLGLDGLTISLNANGHIPERVELLGEVVSTLREGNRV